MTVHDASAATELEHLLEHCFDRVISRVEEAVLANDNFAKTAAMCWKFGH